MKRIFFLTILILSFYNTLLASSKTHLKVEPYTLKLQENYKQEISYIGMIEAKQISKLAFELSGKLTTVGVDEGDLVKKGDTLATLDIKRLKIAKNIAQASIEEAKASLELASINLKRIKEVQRSISPQELDEAITSKDVSIAILKRQEAGLAQIELDIEKSTLKAPYDGIITKKHLDMGSIINMGEPIFTIQDTSTFEARVAIGKKEQRNLRKNQIVSLIWDDKPIKAKVKTIITNTNSTTRTLDLILTLDNTNNFKNNDLVKLNLTNKIEQKGFWIPRSALTHSIQGLWAIYIIEDEKAKRVLVDIIHMDEKRVFIRGTLKDYQKIIKNGIHKIVPNQMVKF